MQGVYATTTAQIMEVMSNLFFSVLIGLGSACGVMIGNRIGAGEERVARIYAARSVLFGACTGLVVGGGLALCSPLFLAFFHVSPGIHAACRAAAYVYAGTMFLRSINMIMVVGVCRSAGDTVFAALIDVLSPWLIGIPMAALGVMVLHWPIYLVILLVSLEEAVKAAFGVWRLLSGKWLNNLVRDLHGGRGGGSVLDLLRAVGAVEGLDAVLEVGVHHPPLHLEGRREQAAVGGHLVGDEDDLADPLVLGQLGVHVPHLPLDLGLHLRPGR